MEGLIKIVSGVTKAMVSPIGGTVTSFGVDGKDVFFPQQMIGEKKRGGCPICAPWFGSSPRGLDKYKHGFLRNLIEQNHIIDKSAVELDFFNLTDRGPYPWDYPWDIRFKTVSLVKDSQLFMALETERLAKDGNASPAPILPAFHPYFACQDASKVVVRIGTGGKEHRGFSEEARSIPLTDNLVVVCLPGWKVAMALDWTFSPPLGTGFSDARIVLWSDAPDKYVCVEPVFGGKTYFEDEVNGKFLVPYRPAKVSMLLSVL